jgi:Domain of unknown function (DUF4214)/Prealbumin-like fold domain
MSPPRSRIPTAVVALVVGVASLMLALGSDRGVAGAAVGQASASVVDAPFQVVVQTMDSCKSGLAGAVYQLSNGSGYSVTVGAQGASSPGGVGPSATCPLQQGNCSATTKGCLVFGNVPPGDYRLRETATPSGNPSNPAGYAPCEGGSACRWQQADVTVTHDGSVGALVTNMYPNGTTVTWPSLAGHSRYYAATAADPVVFHDFGLAPPAALPAPGTTPAPGVNRQCDGDSDADDWSTGSPSSECAYPEASESSVCPGSPAPHFPWACQTGPVSVQHLTVLSRNDAFIADLYHDVLGRTTVPADSEIAYWVGRLLGGTSRAEIAASFVASDEAHGHLVDADYQLMLLRAPDPQGRAYWTSQLDRGAYNESILGLLGGSPEYYGAARKGAGSDGTFIQSLYRDILGRTPAQGEVSYWLGRLASGTPRSSMGNLFAFSHEYHLRLAISWYPKYLGRAFDAGGADYWAGYLDAGNRDDAGIISFVATDEYYGRKPAF